MASLFYDPKEGWTIDRALNPKPFLALSGPKHFAFEMRDSFEIADNPVWSLTTERCVHDVIATPGWTQPLSKGRTLATLMSAS